MENVIVKFTADTTGLEPAIKQLALMGKITDEDAKKIADINAQQQKFNATVGQTTNEFHDWQKAFNGVSDEIKQQVIIEAAKQLGTFTNEAKKGGEQIKSLKTELRELKAQIASGTLGEKEMREATKRAAELTDHLGDVSQKIKALSSDTKRIDAVVEGFRGIAAAVSVGTGAMALFGKENKELEKTLLKVQGAMAILQGVQELSNLAKGEGIVKTYALAAAEGVAAVASRVLGTEIAASTALATGGLTILLAALVYFVSEMDDATESVEQFAERMASSLTLQQKYTDMAINLIANARERDLKKAEVDYFRQERELKESHNKRILDIDGYSKKLSILQQTYKKTEQSINDKYDFETFKKLQESQKKIQDEAKKANEIKKAGLEEWSKMSNEIYVEELRARKKLKEDEIAGEKAYYEMLTEILTDEENIKKANREREAKEQQEWFDKEIAAMQAQNEKKLSEQQQLQESIKQATFSAASTLSNTLFTLTQQNIQARESEEITSIEKTRDAQLKNKEITEAQRAKIEERANRQIAIAKRNAWQQQQQADIAQAVMNGALAVTNALATVKPFPAALVAAGLAAIQTTAQVAIIKNTPIPKFAKGVEMLQGSGTQTSDSIPALLSLRERVVPADVNMDYFPALTAIHNRKVDHTLANEVLTDLANGTFNVSQQYSTTATIDYNKLSDALQRGKSKVVINLDEKGFSHYQIKNTGKINYLNSKFKYEL